MCRVTHLLISPQGRTQYDSDNLQRPVELKLLLISDWLVRLVFHWKTHSMHMDLVLNSITIILLFEQNVNMPFNCFCRPEGVNDDVIKWKYFPRYLTFVRGIHRSPANSPHKGQWRGGLMFSLICAWINGWVNNHEVGDLRRHRAHFDVIRMYLRIR